MKYSERSSMLKVKSMSTPTVFQVSGRASSRDMQEGINDSFNKIVNILFACIQTDSILVSTEGLTRPETNKNLLMFGQTVSTTIYDWIKITYKNTYQASNFSLFFFSSIAQNLHRL